MSLARFITLLFVCFIFGISSAQDTDIQVKSYTYKDTLQLDFYEPITKNNQPRPLIVLMHGGGFASGFKDGAGEVKFCKAMAEKGYAVTSISYRLTRKNDPFNCDCDTAKKMFSFVSAAEDLSDAIHYINKEEGLVFDRNTIVLVGSSAGAEAILHSTFMNRDYRFNHIPEISISGIISLSGAVSNANYISKSNAVPSLFMHGKKDVLVPYGTAPHHYCEEDKTGYLMLDGPETIVSKLKELGTSYILAFDPEGGHDWAFKGYNQIDLVSRFMQDLVINKLSIQETIELPMTEDENSNKHKK
jgi:acetyl esterase/lipase